MFIGTTGMLICLRLRGWGMWQACLLPSQGLCSQLHSRLSGGYGQTHGSHLQLSCLWRTHRLQMCMSGCRWLSCWSVKLLTSQILRQTYEHSAYAGASIWGAAQQIMHLQTASTAASSTLFYSHPPSAEI